MLSDDDKAMLDLAGARYKYAGARDAAIRETFDISPTVFHARVNLLLGQPEALAYAPMTVKRLVRLREARRVARSARRSL